MTREIKFRGWDKEKNVMEYDIAFDGYDFGEIGNGGDFWSNKSLIPTQYTGLKDCEGKELYEGDLYAVKKEPDECGFFEIIWEGCSFYSIWHIQGQKRKQILDDSNWLGINIYYIGNVYENPELIK